MKLTPTHILKALIILFLLLALFDWPYSYYSGLRWAVFMAGAGFAWTSYKKQIPIWPWVWAGAAILFQPFFKIALGRTVWNIVDVIFAGVIVASYFLEKRPEAENPEEEESDSSDDE